MRVKKSGMLLIVMITAAGVFLIANYCFAAPVSRFCKRALSVFAEKNEAAQCVEFLKGYGWETVPEPSDSSAVNIPSEFDEVYKNYNIIQKEAGLDLTPCRGMSGMRYTFAVTNYPVDAGEPVYANVICIQGKPVAGDIMTVSVNGFMHSLKRTDLSE